MEYDYEKQENNEQDSEHLLDEQEARKMHRELDRLISSRRQEKRANGGRIAAIVIGGVALVVAASLVGFNVIHDSGYEYDYDDDESVYETVEGNYELPLDKGVSFTLDGKITPICIAFSYIAGFVVGIIFQTDGIDPGGARTNNLWIIWTVVFICLTLAGIIYDKFISTAKKKIR